MTEKQYHALCKYRDNFVPASGKPDDITLDLCNRGFVHPKKVEYAREDECLVFYQKVFWELTVSGELALEEFEDFIKNTRHEKADKEADKAIDRKFQTKQTILNAVVCAIVSVLFGLAVSHFSEIVSFFLGLFQ